MVEQVKKLFLLLLPMTELFKNINCLNSYLFVFFTIEYLKEVASCDHWLWYYSRWWNVSFFTGCGVSLIMLSFGTKM
jgi:hypothetical protein